MFEDLMRHIGDAVGNWLYLIAGGLAFAEAAIMVGFVLPGEIALLVAGYFCRYGTLEVWIMAIIAVVCAIVGDSVGFEFGRHFGPPVRRSRVDGRCLLAPARRQGDLPRAPHRLVARTDAVDGRNERHEIPDLPGLERSRRPGLGRRLRVPRIRVRVGAQYGQRVPDLAAAGNPRCGRRRVPGHPPA